MFERPSISLCPTKTIIPSTPSKHQMMERFNVDILLADVPGRSAPVQEKSGHSQFAPLKLRSLTVVPSSGAQCAPSNFTYGSSTARLFPPGCAAPVRDSRSFRAPAQPVSYARVYTSIEGSTSSKAGASKRSACG